MRGYTVIFNAVAVSATQDLFEITPADDKPVTLLGMVLGQYTDFGDAQDEVLGLQVIRGFTSSGTAGTTPTPAVLDPVDTAAGFTSDVNNTGLATTGTSVVLWSDCWNVRAGYQVWWPEGAQPKATQANTTILVRMTAPADAFTMNGTLIVGEC